MGTSMMTAKGEGVGEEALDGREKKPGMVEDEDMLSHDPDWIDGWAKSSLSSIVDGGDSVDINAPGHIIKGKAKVVDKVLERFRKEQVRPAKELDLSESYTPSAHLIELAGLVYDEAARVWGPRGSV